VWYLHTGELIMLNVLECFREISYELSDRADREGFSSLAVLFRMAELEAEQQIEALNERNDPN
jgi:hypothetical protein